MKRYTFKIVAALIMLCVSLHVWAHPEADPNKPSLSQVLQRVISDLQKNRKDEAATALLDRALGKLRQEFIRMRVPQPTIDLYITSLRTLGTGYPWERQSAVYDLADLSKRTMPQRMAEPLVAVLSQALRDPKASRVRIFAASVLGRLGPLAIESIPDLIRVLQSADMKQVKLYSIRALGGMGLNAYIAIPILEELEKREQVDAELRREAGAAVKRIKVAIESKGTSLVDLNVKLVNQCLAFAREFVALVDAEKRAGKAVDIRHIFKRTAQSVRWSRIWKIFTKDGEFLEAIKRSRGASISTFSLVRLLVRWGANQSLEVSIGHLVSEYQIVRKDPRTGSVQKRWISAVDELIRELHERDKKNPHTTAFRLKLLTLGYGDQRQRAQVIRSFEGWVGRFPKEFIRPIGLILCEIAKHDSNHFVREASLNVLNKLGVEVPEAVNAFTHILGRADVSVSAIVRVATWLGNRGVAAIGAKPALLLALESPHSHIRLAAAEALGKIDPKSFGGTTLLDTLGKLHSHLKGFKHEMLSDGDITNMSQRFGSKFLFEFIYRKKVNLGVDSKGLMESFRGVARELGWSRALVESMLADGIVKEILQARGAEFTNLKIARVVARSLRRHSPK